MMCAASRIRSKWHKVCPGQWLTKGLSTSSCHTWSLVYSTAVRTLALATFLVSGELLMSVCLTLSWRCGYVFSCQCYCWFLSVYTGCKKITYWSPGGASLPHKCQPSSPPLDNIRVMVIVWRLRGNVIRTAPCWVVWHNVHSQQHTHMSSSYRSSRLCLSHCDPYAMHRGCCLELYYCNMLEWSWWDSSLIWKTNWFPSVLWHCWFGHMTSKNRPRYDL